VVNPVDPLLLAVILRVNVTPEIVAVGVVVIAITPEFTLKAVLDKFVICGVV
jgi:hypothetical protein